LKAKDAALIKSADICSKYFGMSFKEIVVFEKLVLPESTLNETENFVGDFGEVMDKIA
jgi:hypothetical protein